MLAFGGTTVALAVPSALASGGAVSGWLTYGGGLARASYVSAGPAGPVGVHRTWKVHLDGLVTSQLVAAQGPGGSQLTIYVGTSTGRFYALRSDGKVLWQKALGHVSNACTQLPAWGIVGTPAIDPATHSVYVADTTGWLHALDLRTGRERPGWPVLLFDDPGTELVWGGLAIVQGVAYVPTGAYCEAHPEGKLIAVSLATRQRSQWISVPAADGGGGSIWGFGGVAYSRRRDSLFAATGNAYEGGDNVGPPFRESAGYGEQLVELSRSLVVRSASHPPAIKSPLDLDFISSPVIFSVPGCGELAAALDKNGRLYGWDTARVGSGARWSVAVVPHVEVANPISTQVAYSGRTHSLYAVTPKFLTRIGFGKKCGASVVWRRRLGHGLANSSPTISRSVLWFVQTSVDHSSLLGVDLVSGRIRVQARVDDLSFVAPIAVGSRMFVGSFAGNVYSFSVRG
jgi:PQQ-like domain